MEGVGGESDYSGSRALEHRAGSLAIFQMRRSVHFRIKARVDGTYLEGRTF